MADEVDRPKLPGGSGPTALHPRKCLGEPLAELRYRGASARVAPVQHVEPGAAQCARHRRHRQPRPAHPVDQDDEIGTTAQDLRSAPVRHAAGRTEAGGDARIGIDLAAVADDRIVEVGALALAGAAPRASARARWLGLDGSRAEDPEKRQGGETEDRDSDDACKPAHVSLLVIDGRRTARSTVQRMKLSMELLRSGTIVPATRLILHE